MASPSFQRISRTLLLTLSGGVLIAGLWAASARIDIVVNASGKAVPATTVRIAQTAEAGTIKSVLVRDGDAVNKGDLLVELEPLTAAQDVKAVNDQVERLRFQLQQIDAELSGQHLEPSLDFKIGNAVSEEHRLRRMALAASLEEAQAALERAQADVSLAKARLNRAHQLLPLVKEQWEMFEKLLQDDYVSKLSVIEARQNYVDAQQEVHSQAAALTSAQSAVSQTRRTQARIQAEYRRQLGIEKTQLATELAAAEAEAVKRAYRLAQTTIEAPVAGTVNGLASLSAGQVIAAGQSLMSIVPVDEPLLVEAWVRNEDVAFVTEDMPAKIKVAAYPFQKYGWIEAKVTWLGVDAEAPEELRAVQPGALFYRARLQLHSQHLEKADVRLPLRAGMHVVADIQTGHRTVLEYLTSPVRKVLFESARER